MKRETFNRKPYRLKTFLCASSFAREQPELRRCDVWRNSAVQSSELCVKFYTWKKFWTFYVKDFRDGLKLEHFAKFSFQIFLVLKLLTFPQVWSFFCETSENPFPSHPVSSNFSPHWFPKSQIVSLFSISTSFHASRFASTPFWNSFCAWQPIVDVETCVLPFHYFFTEWCTNPKLFFSEFAGGFRVQPDFRSIQSQQS